MIRIFFWFDNVRRISKWKRGTCFGKTDWKLFIHWTLMRKRSAYSTILLLSEPDIQFIFKNFLQLGSTQWFINFLLIHLCKFVCVFMCVFILWYGIKDTLKAFDNFKKKQKVSKVTFLDVYKHVYSELETNILKGKSFG